MGDNLQMLEGVAESFLDETCLDQPPVDPLLLAHAAGLRVVFGRSNGGCMAGQIIRLNPRDRPVRRSGVCAHELAHLALERSEEQHDEQAVGYVAAALLLPRRHFDRDLRASWDLDRLRAKYLHASAEMIARRIVSLRDATASIFDHGKLKTRVVSPWLPERFARLSKWENDLASQALARGETVVGDERCFAFPIFDGTWRRVIVVCEAEQLGFRI